MRVLVSIPHYFREDPQSAYGSGRMKASARASSLAMALHGLLDLENEASSLVDFRRENGRLAANSVPDLRFEIVVCTLGDNHLMETLAPDLRARVHHQPALCPPEKLGFIAQQILANNMGNSFDFYGIMEDDVLISDRYFFDKLAYFSNDTNKVLFPNRFEIEEHRPNRKLYVDGPYGYVSNPEFEHLLNDRRSCDLAWAGGLVRLQKVVNSHAGCFFLSREQMRFYRAAPAFGDHVTQYVSALESAMTFGVMRTFDVYKPARENADFLEIRHLGVRHLVGPGQA
ncbi:hypothetical protein [Pararhodospirillum oryzae]|uniref:Calcium-binding protein n=1 Tax=Pararhodospirillum oryzae TaxID=478448 RepID=A0A512H437_9PROT|nr:hypothetical protein [Pararhodospirillum oryzae]GEO80178.1 hypothetical protein ROR02_03090 [Pararhodospirillum oryzae]